MRYVSMILLVLATACTLTMTAPGTPPPVVTIDQPTALPTQSTALPTTAPATGTPIADSGSQPAPNNPVCVPRADWNFVYVVAAGDTLTKIAQRANSTASALATANCLSDVNLISVGQTLRVPQPVSANLPPTVPPVPGENQTGSVFISSSVSGDAGSYLLLRDETITLRWDNPPANLYRATFVVQTPGSGVITQIAEDANPADGVTATWTVPGGLHGNLMAQGRFLNSNLVVTSFPAGVSAAPAQGLGCELTAASGTTITTYMKPDFHLGEYLTIPSGDFRETLGRSLNGWYAFMPPGSSPYNVDALRWIPMVNNLRGRGNCPPDVPPFNDNAANQTYTNAQVGFMMDYPAGWSQVSQGNYVDFVASDGRTIEILFGQSNTGRTPAEEAAACIEANLCIGDRKILLQQPIPLPDGLTGYRLELSASLTKPDTTPAVYVFTVINNQSLVFRGFSQTFPTFFDDALNSLRLLQF